MPTSDPRSYIGAFNPKPPDTSAYDELSRGAVLQTLADRSAGQRNTATIAGRSGDVAATNLSQEQQMIQQGINAMLGNLTSEGIAGSGTLEDLGLLPGALDNLRGSKLAHRSAQTLDLAGQAGLATPLGSAVDIYKPIPSLYQGLSRDAAAALAGNASLTQTDTGSREVERIMTAIGPDQYAPLGSTARVKEKEIQERKSKVGGAMALDAAQTQAIVRYAQKNGLSYEQGYATFMLKQILTEQYSSLGPGVSFSYDYRSDPDIVVATATYLGAYIQEFSIPVPERGSLVPEVGDLSITVDGKPQQ